MQNKENKNIDQLFKDRLQGIESIPPPVVWENIQEALGHKKRDRKVIPLWFKLGGVAAALVLLFSVANFFSTDSPDGFVKDDNQLVIEDANDLDTEKINKENTNILSKENTDLDVVTNTQDADETLVATENNKVQVIKKTNSSNKPITNLNNRLNTSNSVTSTDGKVKNINNTTNHQAPEKQITNTAVAIKQDINKPDLKNKTQKSPIIIDDKKEIIGGTIKEAVATQEIKETKESIDPITNTIEEKKSIFDAIDEQKEAVAKTTDELPVERWAISPNVAPVYYNSLSQGSSIDPTFADNTQNGEVNVSYGIHVSYAVSPRLTVRSGVSNVNLSYATGGLELATGNSSSALQAITYNTTGTVVTAVDQGVFNTVQGEESPYANLTRKATEGDVFLTQSISYTEIPAELTYNLVNKRFGLNVIGGFSTLLLGNNEVSVSASDFNDVLGEANNLSDVSFSTNVGLGVSYQLTKKFTFNVEPIFKYQLNPYTDNSVQFKPYYVGVYSGLSFKF